jgi:putative ABC transport system ATP-binding protein
MAEHLIVLQDLTRTYHMGDVDVHALRGVSLQIEQGDFVAIMGTSGSGKSTLMNTLGCLDRPSSGSYFLAGRNVAAMSKSELAGLRNQLIGFVFQSFHLLPRTSALENVELPLLYARVPGKERRARARRALERVGLGSRMDHHPNQMSGGQQQRVAIARALVTQPQMLLADEPTGNLDSRTTLEILSLFQELGDEGITVLLVTHEPEVAQYARRVLVLRDGLLVEDRLQTPRRAAMDLQNLQPADAVHRPPPPDASPAGDTP